MKFQIKYTENAEDELNGIFDYIAEDNLEKAIEFTEHLKGSVKKIADFPLQHGSKPLDVSD